MQILTEQKQSYNDQFYITRKQGGYRTLCVLSIECGGRRGNLKCSESLFVCVYEFDLMHHFDVRKYPDSRRSSQRIFSSSAIEAFISLPFVRGPLGWNYFRAGVCYLSHYNR